MSHSHQYPFDARGSGNQGQGNYYAVDGAQDSRAHLNSAGFAYPPEKNYPMNSTGKKWYQKKWLWVLAIVLLLAAIGGGIGGGLAARNSSNDSSSSRGISNNAAEAPAAASSDANGNPIYTSTAAAAAPTATAAADASCPSSNPQYNTGSSGFQIRTDHPLLMADSARWSCLPSQIQSDAYLRSWDSIIMANATRYAAMDPVQYTPDGGLSGSGVLDVARELQLRTKHWAYAWRMTNDSQWVERTWQELLVASGNSSQEFGADGTRWNPSHFLDVAEFTAAFAYSYDWMYDAWTEERRNAIMWSIINLGLRYGLNSYTQETGYGWWQTTNGNWNNVCNGGLTLGALAVANEDPTGIAQQLLSNTVANVKENGVFGVMPDGTWSETADYWYFGNQGLSQMISALQTATGSDQGIFSANPAFNLTGMFHIYGTGFVEKFNWGDCGPNKYTATANALLLYGDHFDLPLYQLYQRDRADVADPLSMLWYNPNVQGDWWYNLPLDRNFPDSRDAWASLRSSWTDGNGLYTAMKAGNATGHQTHGNLDAGTFVIEALGERWAGELCQNDYLAPGYFGSEAQDSERWTYYRCMTEGQNTLSFNGQNQIVGHAPPTTYGSTGERQTALSYSPPADSAGFIWSDLSGSYSSVSSVRRGLRVYNQRRQVLLRDEITGAQNAGQWRMHTNATITYSDNNRVATLSLGEKSLTATILDTAPTLTFQTLAPNRTADAPQLRDGGYDLPNPGVSVLAIDIPSGDTTLEVLFNPQWDGLSASDFKTPSSVSLSDWSTTSPS